MGCWRVCKGLGGLERQKAGPGRESHASSRGGGGESDAWRAEGRGTIWESLLRGMTVCLLSPSLSVLPVRSMRTWEAADGKAAQAEVACRHLSHLNLGKWGVRWASDSPWGVAARLEGLKTDSGHLVFSCGLWLGGGVLHFLFSGEKIVQVAKAGK